MTTKPKYFKKDLSVKSIIIHGKEWFDKMYGNSYNAAQVVINEGLKNEFSFNLEFSYGYGDYYEQRTFEKLIEMGVVSSRSEIYNRKYDGKVILISNIDRKCLKREVVAWGKS